MPITALIADDEPLLAQALHALLTEAWPDLQVLATVGDGASALACALQSTPDVLFLDIRMPGMDGLEAAAALVDVWPASKPFPALVFVTAYDQYAVQAFETQAVDYLLKPVQPERLRKTVARLQSLGLGQSGAQGMATDEMRWAQLGGLHDLLAHVVGAHTRGALPRLQFIAASLGNQVHMVPVAEVVYFEAADKYVRVVTEMREYTIRTPLKDLLPQLDTQSFWQIHRGTVVRAQAVASVLRDESGKLQALLHGRTERLAVSRLYAHLFRAM
ncbi:LytR/AlgR family response regulator transcription factor [Variovorax sp. HJSM1_2]|uniref:LytR/AlgR family response regulator transcription factor n=1 Tax=Variovorax sp. HJSM1_2 TaxID=3366263 RepID=UPI003BDAF2E5